jgi:hypothetical protein
MGYVFKFYERLVNITMQPGTISNLTQENLEYLKKEALEQSIFTRERLARSLLRQKKASTMRLHVKNYVTVLNCLIRICEGYEAEMVYQEDPWRYFLSAIKEVLNGLVAFIEQRFIGLLPEHPPKPVEGDEPFKKVHSKLSVDQLALIIRAAYDQGVIVTKSLNHLFRTLVPYLSTDERRDLSFGSMRSKSYNAEIKDKELTIAVLSQLAETIKNY